MEFTIKVSGLEDIAAAVNNLADALKAGAKTGEVIEKAQTAAKSTRSKKVDDPKPAELPTQKDSASEATAAPVLAEATSTSASLSKATAPISREAIQAACVGLSKKHGPGKTKAVIESFGVRFSKDVPDDKLADLFAALTAALEDVNG